jgi:hypothetical protein
MSRPNQIALIIHALLLLGVTMAVKCSTRLILLSASDLLSCSFYFGGPARLATSRLSFGINDTCSDLLHITQAAAIHILLLPLSCDF